VVATTTRDKNYMIVLTYTGNQSAGKPLSVSSLIEDHDIESLSYKERGGRDH